MLTNTNSDKKRRRPGNRGQSETVAHSGKNPCPLFY